MASFFEMLREATTAEIDEIIQRFGRSAAICKKAGFSGGAGIFTAPTAI